MEETAAEEGGDGSGKTLNAQRSMFNAQGKTDAVCSGYPLGIALLSSSYFRY
jgi:hypothetical protein